MNQKLMSIIDQKESRLILFYGRPSQGKTRYVSKVMLEKAEQSKKIAFVSLEMDREAWLVKMNILPYDDRLKNIDFYDEPSTSGNINQLNQAFDGKDYDFIVIDYLELMSFASGETEKALRELYDVMLEWKCPVIAVSQTPHMVNDYIARPGYFEEKEDARTRFNFILVDIKFDGIKMTAKSIGTHRTATDNALVEKLRGGKVMSLAEEFYKKFKDKMKENALDENGTTYFDVYQNSGNLTGLLKNIVPKIIEGMNCTPIYPDAPKKERTLLTQHEYFRIDCIGYQQRKSEITDDAKKVGLNPHLWDLKVAVEYENNSADWADEVIKLAHIRCPLKVVIGYSPCDQRGEPEKKKLSAVAKWMKKLEAYDKDSKEELLIILGNCKSTNPSEKYNEFDYRGYIYSYSLGEFQRIM